MTARDIAPPRVLRRADQTLSAPFYAVLNDYGVARSEWRVLAVLRELGSLPVVDLAEAALSPQPTVTHALRRLEKKGLVSRAHGPDDRRQRIISMTQAGSALTEALIAEAKQLETQALSDADDVSELLTQLRTLTASIEARTTNGAVARAEAG